LTIGTLPYRMATGSKFFDRQQEEVE